MSAVPWIGWVSSFPDVGLSRRLLGPLLAGLLAVGCAQPTLPPADDDAKLPPATLAPWTASGKLAWTTADGTETANFVWDRQSGGREVVTLSGPIGLGATRIERDGEAVFWIEDGRPRSLDSLSLSADAAAALAGLPFASLGGWLLGDFSSAGEWSPEVLAWTGAGGWRLPRTLTFRHPRAALRVAILDWDLPGPKPQ